jgi:hypothetical protein
MHLHQSRYQVSSAESGLAIAKTGNYANLQVKITACLDDIPRLQPHIVLWFGYSSHSCELSSSSLWISLRPLHTLVKTTSSFPGDSLSVLVFQQRWSSSESAKPRLSQHRLLLPKRTRIQSKRLLIKLKKQLPVIQPRPPMAPGNWPSATLFLLMDLAANSRLIQARRPISRSLSMPARRVLCYSLTQKLPHLAVSMTLACPRRSRARHTSIATSSFFPAVPCSRLSVHPD